MMPLSLREALPESYHTFLNPLDEAKVTEFLSFSLRDAYVDFSAQQLSELKDIVDGVPLNVKFAVKAVRSYGLVQFLADPSVLLEWKRRRGEDILSRIEFPKLEAEIISLLLEFPYLEFEFVRDNVTAAPAELGQALRRLEEFCCIERRGSLTVIYAAVREAAARDKRFKRNNRWRGEIALKVLDSVSAYKGDENVPIALLETAAKAAIISGKFSGIATQFILPSHFLILANEAYADDRRKDCIDFCKKAYQLRARLSLDGRIEVLRLWGLSAIRLGDEEELGFALKELEAYRARKTAKRNMFFLRGFQLRLKKNYDEAERQFLQAYKIAPRNLSVNRELASLYRHRGEYVEAEGYARDGYDLSPTNPFVIDVLLESLLGKASQDIKVDHDEIGRLFVELRRYGDVPGSSFYQARMAQDLFRQKKKSEALSAADAAIKRTPEFLPVYFLRAEIRLSMNDTKGARADLKTINEILDRRGGVSEDDEGRTTELEVKILTEEKQFRSAKEKVNTAIFIPSSVRRRLKRSLARAISYELSDVDVATKNLALQIIRDP